MTTEAGAESMQVVVHVTRRDVFGITFRQVIRAPWLWALFTIPFALVMWRVWISPSRPTDWLHAATVVGVFAVLFLALLFIVALLVAAANVLQVSSMHGVLGSHTFEIRPDGLFESTTANQTLTHWSALRNAIRTDRYILVGVAWWMFHFIPRRSFPNAAAYDAFFVAIQERIHRTN